MHREESRKKKAPFPSVALSAMDLWDMQFYQFKASSDFYGTLLEEKLRPSMPRIIGVKNSGPLQEFVRSRGGTFVSFCCNRGKEVAQDNFRCWLRRRRGRIRRPLLSQSNAPSSRLSGFLQRNPEAGCEGTSPPLLLPQQLGQCLSPWRFHFVVTLIHQTSFAKAFQAIFWCKLYKRDDGLCIVLFCVSSESAASHFPGTTVQCSMSVRECAVSLTPVPPFICDLFQTSQLDQIFNFLASQGLGAGNCSFSLKEKHFCC